VQQEPGVEPQTFSGSPTRKAIYTGSYLHLHGCPREIVRVAISLGKPRWFEPGSFVEEPRLAPPGFLFHVQGAEFDLRFRQWLERFDVGGIWERLPPRGILCCWEPATDPEIREDGGLFCHRRVVAQWFHDKLGVDIAEWPVAGDAPAHRPRQGRIDFEPEAA
jgi:hypothetical protein